MGWTNTAGGVLQATTVIITAPTPGAGLFVYSGTPGPGTLIASIAATAGTDPYGNPFPQGFASITPTRQITINNGQIILHSAGSVIDASVNVSGSGAGLLQINSNTTAAAPDFSELVLTPAAHPTTTGSAPSVTVTAPTNTGAVADLRVTGTVIKGSTPTTWQTPAYNAGWAGDSAVGGTFQPLQYRFDAFDNVVFDGVMHTTSATPNAVAFTLPAAYRPAKAHRFVSMSNAGGTLVVVFVNVLATGDVTVTANPTATNVDVSFENSVPLGVLP